MTMYTYIILIIIIIIIIGNPRLQMRKVDSLLEAVTFPLWYS